MNGIEAVRSWIDSGAYDECTNDAGLGDIDSVELIENVDLYLRTICFHLTDGRDDAAEREAKELANYLSLPWS